ncbi:MAG: hypothetical protein U9Q73_01915 [Nanoarchaeota archaeon]|nr:hypothetical protein [Nanoarchaeota archaeon]
MSESEKLELKLKNQALQNEIIQDYNFYKKRFQEDGGRIKTDLPKQIKSKIKKGKAKPLL